MAATWPVYLETYERGLLRAKAKAAGGLLGRRAGNGQRPVCRVCPRGCLVARLDKEYDC